MTRNLATGRVAAVGRRKILSVLDPRDMPGLMAGAIYIPGVGVSSLGGGSSRWASQATASGDDYDLKNSHTGDKPVATTASNGAAIWDLAAGGTQASWSINTGSSPRVPGAALQFSQRGSIAGWFKANDLDTSIQFFYSMWPGGASGNRVYIYKNDDFYRVAAFTSYAGSAVDAASPPDIGQRAKYNTGSGPGLGPLTDWRLWHFVRFTYDMSLTNYTLSGGNFSDRLKVYIDEVLIENNATTGAGGYSAPASNVGGAPPDGPIRGIHNGATRFSIGADFVSSHWKGQIGPQYIENADAGTLMTSEQWQRVMLYGAPA